MNNIKTLIKYGAYLIAAVEVLEFALSKFEAIKLPKEEQKPKLIKSKENEQELSK